MKINLQLPLSLIGALTIVTGAVQVVTPGFVLDLLAVETNPASLHFFAIVGMFMVLFGGLLLHALYAAPPQPAGLLWAGLQKLGAAVAVGLGVVNGVFAAVALFVAGFDLLSGVLILAHWRAVRTRP